MENTTNVKKPSKLLIIIPAIIFIIAILFAVINCVNSVVKMVNSSDEIIKIPDTKELDFKESGKYTVYLQTKGADNGQYYSLSKDIQGLKCKVYNETNNINVGSCSMNTEMSSGSNEFQGILEFKITNPGKYTVETSLEDSSTDNVNIMIQRSDAIFKMIMSIFISIFSFLGGIGVLIGFIIFYCVKKSKYDNYMFNNRNTVY